MLISNKLLHKSDCYLHFSKQRMLFSYSNINSQVDPTITKFIDNYNQLNMFRAIVSPILRSTRLCLKLWYNAPAMLLADHQQAASPVHYTTNCKHSLMLLRMGETIARNMLS